MTKEAEGIKKVPRCVRIEDPKIKMLIQQAMDGPILTPDKIADAVARYHRAMERQSQEQHDRIWAIINEMYPETLDGTWSFNPYSSVVMEALEEAPPNGPLTTD